MSCEMIIHYNVMTNFIGYLFVAKLHYFYLNIRIDMKIIV